MSEWWITILGVVAGVCTTGSFLPQVIKAWRERDTGAISLRMYLVTTVGFCLWISYGFVLGSWPIMIFNVIALGLGGIILWLKLRERKVHSSPDQRSVRA
jgi:MtN3 and saliva related transmembrane protein